MWIRRTSRGRRDLPLSDRDVAGIWVGWEAEEVVLAFWGVCDEVLFMLALLEVGSVVGGVRGWVDVVGWVWPGDAIVDSALRCRCRGRRGWWIGEVYEGPLAA